MNHVHVSSRLGDTSCWPELMQLAVDRLPAADSSLYLFLLDGIVPQQLLSVDKKRVLGLNYQLPNLSWYTFVGLPLIQIPIIFKMYKEDNVVWVVAERLRHKILIFERETLTLPWKWVEITITCNEGPVWASCTQSLRIFKCFLLFYFLANTISM